MIIATSTGTGIDLTTDLVDPELGLPVGIEGIVLTTDITQTMILEILPGRRKRKKETMTLAMGDTIEGAARRPCFMGGPL